MDQDLRAWKWLYRAGAGAVVAVLAMLPVQIAVFLLWPPPPNEALAWFALFQERPFIALLDLDLLMVVDNALLVVTAVALAAALWRSSPWKVALGTVLSLSGAVLFFASNPGFEMLTLSGRYAAATSEAERLAALGAGEAMLATWTGTAFNVAYVLSGVSALLLAAAVLQGRVFSRATGYVGLVYGATALLPASAGKVGFYLAFASLLPMCLWLGLIAFGLFRLAGGGAARAPRVAAPPPGAVALQH